MANLQADNDKLIQQIEAIRQQAGMASAYVLMVDREQILEHRGLGVRWWTDPRPVTDKDYYRLGSISKAFTGLALLKAQEQGCLNLSANLNQVTPNALYSNRWETSHPMSVAMLMEHTTGWHDMSGFEFTYNTPLNLTEALKLRPESRVSQWRPGLHYEYSNSGPGMAGWVLEETCGVDFDRYIETNVFEPLGMHSATLNRTPDVDQHIVGGYNTNPKERIRYWNFLFRPAGSMNVRPVEMAKFLQLLLNRGQHEGKQIFSTEQIERMETPVTTLAAQTGLKHGYGLGIRASVKNGHVIHGHGGDADGYLTRFSYSPESGRGFFVVITMFDHAPLRQMRDLLETWLVDGLPALTPTPRAAIETTELQKLTGVYHRASTRFPRPGWQDQTLSLSIRNNKLGYQRNAGRWLELIPTNQQHFRRRNEPVATTAIICEADTCYLQGSMGNWVRE